MLQGSTSATRGEHDGIVVDTHLLGIHDLVGRDVLQHAILMDTARVSKGVATHNGLVGLHGHIHQRAYHAARGVYLLRVDVGLDAQVGVRLEYHCHLLQ